MRVPSLAPRDRRALLVGAASVLPALIWAGVVRPFRAALTDVREQRSVQEALLHRERALVRRDGAGPTSASDASAPSRLFVARDADAAAAELASYVRDAAADAGVRLVESEAGDHHAPAGDVVQALVLRIRGEGELQGVLSMLAALRTGTRAVLVEALALDAGVISGDANALGFAATLRGYRSLVDSAQYRSPSVANATPRFAEPPTAPGELAERVADLAPFSATRERGAMGDDRAEPPTAAASEGLAPAVRVLGTVVGGPDDTFAICQLDGAPGKVVRVGAAIGTLRLTRVEAGAAHFVDEQGRRVTIRVTDPGT